MESKADTLSEMIANKWYKENWCARLHLEQYNPDKLEDLIISRIRKLSKEINEEQSREPMPIRTESLDEIFQSILAAGLIAPTNPKQIGEQEQAAANEAADRAQTSADADFILAIMRYEKAVGQRGISQWYHSKATKQQKEWYDRLFPSGAVRPESPSQQANLFIVKATLPDGRIKFVSGDVSPVPLDSTAAHRFGRTNAQRFADLLAKQRPELKKIEIVSLTQTERGPELSDESLDKYAGNLHREIWERELAERKRA